MGLGVMCQAQGKSRVNVGLSLSRKGLVRQDYSTVSAFLSYWQKYSTSCSGTFSPEIRRTGLDGQPRMEITCC